MRHKYRRGGILAAIVVTIATAAPGAVFAADPAVEYDATITVRYVDAVMLLPVDSAAVVVTARQGEADLGSYTGTTDAAGVAGVGGLPRAIGDGAPVRLGIVADKATSVEDVASGCVLAETWHAELPDVALDAATLEVAFAEDEQDSTSSMTCTETEPTGAVDAATGHPNLTLPPTDSVSTPSRRPTDTGAAIAVGFIFAMAGVSLIVRRPRRRDRSGDDGS
jgi:hypothetical protein